MQLRLVALLSFLASHALLAACVTLPASTTDAGSVGDTGSTRGDASASTACTAIRRTCAQILASFASSSTDVSVTCDDAAGTFTIRSTGTPNYDSNQTTPNAIADQGWVVELPLAPTCSDTTIDVIASRGPVGFMINGVPFYGPEDANGNDAVVNEGPTFDDCDGHADMGCSYHYHEEPICVFGVHDTAPAHAEADGHPAVIGYGLDGFAIYASYIGAAPDVALDACNGHDDPVRGYHYHATSSAPYLLGCYHGTESGRMMHTMMLCTNGVVNADGGITVDAGVPVGDGGAPRSCSSSADCAGACPPGSAGCTCTMGMTSGMICVPSCASATDCPTGLSCDTARGICHP